MSQTLYRSDCFISSKQIQPQLIPVYQKNTKEETIKKGIDDDRTSLQLIPSKVMKSLNLAKKMRRPVTMNNRWPKHNPLCNYVVVSYNVYMIDRCDLLSTFKTINIIQFLVLFGG